MNQEKLLGTAVLLTVRKLFALRLAELYILMQIDLDFGSVS